MVDLNNLKFGKINRVADTGFRNKDLTKISKFESISPPSVFIGSKLSYPLVNVGILSPVGDEENAGIYDDCQTWAKEKYSISDVVKLRTGLLNSRFQSRVQDARMNKKFVEIAKDIAIANKPVDVEIELKDRIASGSRRDQVVTPHGMRAQLKDAKVTSNVKVNRAVDRVINDDVKATKGISMLYKNGINEYSLQKILSVGVMGLKKDKKMVPTRWSITATDDTISKELQKKVRNYPEITDHQLFFGEFLGNQYLILLFPGVFSFELFEFYYPGSSWNPTTEFKASHDYEGYAGRTTYASNCVGGYYATRLPVVEYLDKIKRQASVLAIRLETPSYWAALGVWVVRESVKKAMAAGGMRFGDKAEFLEGVKKIGKAKYDFDPQIIYDKSWLLHEAKTQKRLSDFW